MGTAGVPGGLTSGGGVQIPLAGPIREIADGDPTLGRYRRSWLVAGIGRGGQARIAASRVLVVGAGGLGSPVLLYLAAAGVGTIGVCDSDIVETHNLQRQVIHGGGGVGALKTDSVARRLADLNPDVRLECFGHVTWDFLQEHGRDWDLIVECTDNFDAKYLVADWCERSGVPLVWGTVVGMDFQVSVFWSKPVPGVPATSLRMLHPRVPEPGTTPSSLVVGVLGPVVGQAGSAMATEAIKLLTGIGQPLIGRVLVASAARNRYDILPWAGSGTDPGIRPGEDDPATGAAASRINTLQGTQSGAPVDEDGSAGVSDQVGAAASDHEHTGPMEA